MNLLRAPLLHFLLIGAAIYFAYGLFGSKAVDESDGTILITTGEIDWLAQSFAQKWNRPPRRLRSALPRPAP